MTSRCEQIGHYFGLGIAGGTIGTLSGYGAARILSYATSSGMIFGSVSGVSFPIISKIAANLMGRTTWRNITIIPHAVGTFGSLAIGYAAHELTKPKVEIEPPFYKLAGLTYGIGLAAFTGLNIAYCALKRGRPEAKQQEPYVNLSDAED